MSRITKKVTATILSMSLLTVMAATAIAPAMGIIRQHFASAPDMHEILSTCRFNCRIYFLRRSL